MLKNISLILLLILNVQQIHSQNTEQYIVDVVNDNFRVEEKAFDIGLKKNVKSIKVGFQEIKADKKASIIDAMIGFTINYDENGFPVSYYKYNNTSEFQNKELVIEPNKMNYIFFSKSKLIEKQVKNQDFKEDLYDKNGNLIESSSKYFEEVDRKISDSLNTITPKVISDFTIKKYKYNKFNKVTEQIDYETTFDKNVLVPYLTTRNKYYPNGKILESEVVDATINPLPTNKRNITIYKYNPQNKLISIVNKFLESNTVFKYMSNGEMESMTATNPQEIRKIEYKNKRFSTITITDINKAVTKMTFEYIDDVYGNWTLTIINQVTIDASSNKTENKYEFSREIEYLEIAKK